MYKLYKLVVEHTIVVAAESRKDLEKSLEDILVVHVDTILRDGPSNFDFDRIKDSGDLPDGWDVNCRPYSKYPIAEEPEELRNKTIEYFL
jgi:hypothetical protein